MLSLRLSLHWLKVSLMVIGLILSKPLLLVGASPLPLLVSSSLTKIRVLVGISFWLVPLLWQLLLCVLSCQTAGLLLILLFVRSLRSLLGTLLLKGPGFILPHGLLAGWIALIALDLLSLR